MIITVPIAFVTLLGTLNNNLLTYIFGNITGYSKTFFNEISL